MFDKASFFQRYKKNIIKPVTGIDGIHVSTMNLDRIIIRDELIKKHPELRVSALIVAGASDEHGLPLFVESDLSEVAKLDPDVANSIAYEIADLNGMIRKTDNGGAAAAESATGENSTPTCTDSLGNSGVPSES